MTTSALVIAVSDATGETAQQTCRAALAQFGQNEDALILVRALVLDDAGLEKCVLEAKQIGALVAYTVVEPSLRTRIRELATEHDVPAVDLLGGLITGLARHMGRVPLSVPGLGHELDEEYFKRVAAVEFAVYNDDGREPRNLKKADIVIVGISRTSKTPLSNYIAHRGYKVANVPLVLDLPIPPELDAVDPQRVFGLVIEPSILMKIRKERMDALLMQADSEYGDLQYIRREGMWAKRILDRHPDWTVINVTRKAVEETAARILELYRARFEGERAGAKSPSEGKKTKGKKSKDKRSASTKGKREGTSGGKKPKSKKKRSSKKGAKKPKT